MSFSTNKPLHIRIGTLKGGAEFALFDPRLNLGVFSPMRITDPPGAQGEIRAESRNGALGVLAREMCAVSLPDRPFEAWSEVGDAVQLRYSGASWVAQARFAYRADGGTLQKIRWIAYPSPREEGCPTCDDSAFMFKSVCVRCYSALNMRISAHGKAS